MVGRWVVGGGRWLLGGGGGLVLVLVLAWGGGAVATPRFPLRSLAVAVVRLVSFAPELEAAARSIISQTGVFHNW